MKTIIYSLFYLIIALGYIPLSNSAELYFIDAHSQVDHDIDQDEIIQSMNAAGIKKSILSSRRKRRAFDVADWAEHHPDKIIASVRVKSKHYSNNTKKFYKKIKKQIKSGGFNAMSEVLLYHAQKGDKADEVIIYPDDERIEFLLAKARQYNWPFVLHIEFSSLDGDRRDDFYNKMVSFISANSDHPFAMIHMGQLKANEVATLLENHSNLYFLTSHSNPIAVQRSNQPWVNMFEGKELKPEWKSLMIKYPERFIFALDNVWTEHWRNDYKEQVDVWRYALQKLPEKVAHAVAHGNAEKLWVLE